MSRYARGSKHVHAGSCNTHAHALASHRLEPLVRPDRHIEQVMIRDGRRTSRFIGYRRSMNFDSNEKSPPRPSSARLRKNSAKTLTVQSKDRTRRARRVTILSPSGHDGTAGQTRETAGAKGERAGRTAGNDDRATRALTSLRALLVAGSRATGTSSNNVSFAVLVPYNNQRNTMYPFETRIDEDPKKKNSVYSDFAV